MLFFKKRKRVEYSAIIPVLEQGNEPAIINLLWQRQGMRIDFLPVTVEMIQKLKKPGMTAAGLAIHKTIHAGNFELIIFELPWQHGSQRFSPLIFDTRNEKVAGIMLPFNELADHLSIKDKKSIDKLAVAWIRFSMIQNFK